jgi:hypothetical protein
MRIMFPTIRSSLLTVPLGRSRLANHKVLAVLSTLSTFTTASSLGTRQGSTIPNALFTSFRHENCPLPFARLREAVPNECTSALITSIRLIGTFENKAMPVGMECTSAVYDKTDYTTELHRFKLGDIKCRNFWNHGREELHVGV